MLISFLLSLIYTRKQADRLEPAVSCLVRVLLRVANKERLAKSRSKQSVRLEEALLLESLEAGRQSCEAAALTAQILVMGFRQPAAVEAQCGPIMSIALRTKLTTLALPVQVQKLLVLPDAFAGHQPSWAANWFLSLPAARPHDAVVHLFQSCAVAVLNMPILVQDPAVLVLSGWYVFFAALLDALKQGQQGCRNLSQET